MRVSILAKLLLVVPALAVTQVEGGVIRHDRSPDSYQQLAESYTSVGRVWGDAPSGDSRSVASGTLIDQRWVLTAAHVITSDGMRFEIDGDLYPVIQTVIHPDWDGRYFRGNDLALLELAHPVTDVTPAVLHDGDDAVGRVGTMVGYGRTGTGLSGGDQMGGTRRAGQNMIDSTGSGFWPILSDDLLMADFDYPHTLAESLPMNLALGLTDIPTMLTGSQHINRMGQADPLELEYLPASGDSGGGVFIEVDGIEVLSGVISFNLAWDGSNNASYTDMVGIVPIGMMGPWFESNVPEPSTSVLLLCLAVPMLGKIRGTR